jgi:uncharacterized protein
MTAMSLEQDLRAQLTAAMKAKDQRTADTIRMINTKIMERRTAKGFSGQVDDAMITDVIAAYKKSLQKAKEEFINVGDRGKDQADALQWEIEFCDRFLPKGMSSDEIRAAVRAAITATGAKDVKMAGRIVGEVMKAHKGKVEAGEVKRIAEEELSKPA